MSVYECSGQHLSSHSLKTWTPISGSSLNKPRVKWCSVYKLRRKLLNTTLENTFNILLALTMIWDQKDSCHICALTYKALNVTPEAMYHWFLGRLFLLETPDKHGIDPDGGISWAWSWWQSVSSCGRWRVWLPRRGRCPAAGMRGGVEGGRGPWLQAQEALHKPASSCAFHHSSSVLFTARVNAAEVKVFADLKKNSKAWQ